MSDQYVSLIAQGYGRHVEAGAGFAEAQYRQALALQPAGFDALHLLGVALRGLGRPVESVGWLTRALRIDPASAQALHNHNAAVGDLYQAFVRAYNDGELLEVAVAAAAALNVADSPLLTDQVRRDIGVAVNNVAFIADGDGRGELAARAARLAADMAPSAETVNQRRLTLLGRRDYAAAWDAGLWRRVVAQAPASAMWDGGPHDGRLMVLNRNGTGDFFQFMRFIPQARARAARVGVLVKREIGALLRGSPLLEGVDIFNQDPGEPGTVYCDAFGLPAAMGLGAADIGARPFPHIVVPAAERRIWRAALRADERPLIGVAWSSWANNDHRAFGYPFIHDLIEANPGAVFVGLHSSFGKNDLRKYDFADNFRFFGVCDMPTTGVIVDGLDLVIAPDGGVAHLACAMAKPTWVLATRNCDWRWRFEPPEPVDWYPTARLFRQAAHGDWSDVRAQVADALPAFIAEHCGQRR